MAPDMPAKSLDGTGVGETSKAVGWKEEVPSTAVDGQSRVTAIVLGNLDSAGAESVFQTAAGPGGEMVVQGWNRGR